jgi:YbbR domain-containing protein
VKRLWPFRHFWLKLLALGLAVALWVVVSGEAIVERGLRVPLELQRFPPDLELRTEVPSTVEVRVRGGSGALSRLSAADIVAVIDLGGTSRGQRLFNLTPDQVRVPFGVDIVQITPATIAMVFEKSVTKAVPIAPVIDGKPAPGFVVGKITSDPDMVEIVGPESSVKRAATALTEPVSIAGARDRVRGTVTVGVLDATLRLKTTRSAVVQVEIAPAPFERPLRALPVHWRNLASRLIADITPSTVDLHVRGDREALSRVGADSVNVYVDLMGLGAGQYSLSVRAEAAHADVGMSQIDPPQVQVQITRDKN